MRRVVALLLALLTAAVAGPSAAVPAQLPTDTVEVRLTTMTPLDPQPGRTLRLSGVLRNRSDADVTAIQVRLLLSPGPLATRSEIGTVVAGGTDRDGPPTLAVSEPLPVLTARTSLTWSLEFPLDELPLSSVGVYVMGLEVIGTGPDGLTQRLGLTRSFLPWFPEDSVQPTLLAWLWPVTGAPDRALDAVQLSESTASEMAPGGRLSRIVDGAGTADVTWVLDPALLQTAQEMTDGYTVVDGRPGSPAAAGSGDTLAADWLGAVRDAARTGSTVATSYALPDAPALERARMTRTVAGAIDRAAADVSALTRTRTDDVLAWPPGGYATPQTMRVFRDAGASELLVSDTSFPATPALTYTPDGFTTWGGLPVVLADSGMSAALTMPQDTRSQALLARQRFLAEVAMVAGELPDASRSLIAAPDPLWAPRTGFLKQTLRALDQVPYADLVTLAAARRDAVEVTRTRVPYGPAQRAEELTRDYLDAVQRQQRQARRFETILTSPAGLGYDESVMRQTSAAWRADPARGTRLVRTVSQQLTEQIGKVRVATAGTFTLPGDTGRIPVTVANDLDQDVTVGIRLESDEPARLVAPAIEPFLIPAGRKISREVEAKVIGSGTLPVRIQLTTPPGRRYGQPVTVQVRTTAYSQAAAYVVSAAFVVLAFLLGMNFVRRQRARRRRV